MAKMMMGQIDHARTRLRELVSDKCGNQPKVPKYRNREDALKEIREGKRTVSAPQLRKAFDAFLNGEITKRAETRVIGYGENKRYEVSVKETVPTCIEDALADVFYGNENFAAQQKFLEELRAYETKVDAIQNEAKRVEDAIVLGDQQAALQALQEFARFEV